MGRPREHGYAALWVIGAIVVSAAVGVAVYLVIKEQRAASANITDEAPPADASLASPTPEPARPVTPSTIEPPAAVPENAAVDQAATDPDEGMFGTPAIEGALERAAVEAVVQALAPRLERCLAQRVAQGADVDGVMRVTLVVNRRGGVDEATSEGLDAGLPPCVLGVMKSVRFGRPRDGGKARVVYPLAFHGEAAVSGEQCDEVECVLTNYASSCCAKFKAPARPAPDPSANEAPTREEIAAAFRSITPQIRACAEASGFTGMLRVRAKFSPSGRVASASLDDASPELAACALRAARTLTLGASREGATVTFPYSVR